MNIGIAIWGVGVIVSIAGIGMYLSSILKALERIADALIKRDD
jgi:hypothetical protein